MGAWTKVIKELSSIAAGLNVCNSLNQRMSMQ